MTLTELEKITASSYSHSMRDQLRELVYARSEAAFAAGDMARDAVVTVAALMRRQRRARAVFLAVMGGLPPRNTPLNAREVGTLHEKGFRIEKVIFESRPGTPVTANLYVPDGVTSPRGAVLFLCGHHEQAKHAGEYQVVCRHLVKAGLVVLAQDPVGQGERFSYYEKALKKATVGCCCPEHDHAGAQCLPLGDGIARYFLHDAMRGVDYLRTRPEVDPSRIGVTGNSGGGTQTSMMMLADPRIAAAAPGTFIMNRRTYQQTGGAQDAEQIWRGFSKAGFDHEDILLGMCPKPVCVLAVTSDFFPIEGTRETVQRCRRLWKLAGRTADLKLVEDVSMHAYTPVLARAAARFFSRHLLGKAVAVDSAGIASLDPRRLWCTRSGQVRGEIRGARAVWEENRDRLAKLEAARAALPEARRRRLALAWLNAKVRGGRGKVPLNLRVSPKVGTAGKLTADLGYWWSQKGVFNEGLLFRDSKGRKGPLPVTLALWEGGTTALQRHASWLRKTCGTGRAVLVLNLSGMGGIEPNPLNAIPVRAPYGAIHKLNDDLIWLDDSLCALRTWDVLRALEVVGEWPGLDASDVAVVARGREGLYAELAAALEPRLARLEAREGLESFGAWVRARHYEAQGSRAWVLSEVLKYADLPDFRRWR